MTDRRLASQSGLALLGSLLLVSMLAVMSTTFLLVMAADVRIAQSHYRNTQASFTAETALEVAGYYLSQGASLPLAWKSGVDTFSVFEVVPQPVGYPSYKRLIQITAFSGNASFDLFADILSPQQDPRSYFAIAAGTVLELRNGSRVEGGEGVYMSGSDPQVQSGFRFFSPTPSNPTLWIGGDITWDDTYYLHSYWDGILDIRTGIRLLAGPDTSEALVPQILLSEAPISRPNGGRWPGGLCWPYRISGSATTYYAKRLPQDLPDWSWPRQPPYGPDSDNPMGIWVWNYSSNGTYQGNITINGTLYCPDWYSDLQLQPGFGNTFEITPCPHPTLAETYPALVSKGDVLLDGRGYWDINGLVYVRDTFETNPSWPDTVYIDGALVANRISLLRRTVVRYDPDVYARVPGPMLTNTYPTAVLQRRRYVFSWWGF